MPLHVDPQAGVHGEKLVPVGFPGLVVEEIIVPRVEAPNRAEHIQSRSQAHVRAIKPCQIGGNFDSPLVSANDLNI